MICGRMIFRERLRVSRRVRPDELSIIDRYFRPLAGKGAFNLIDDAGQISFPAACDLVVTTDMVASDMHFLRGDPAETVGRKALRVNISDLAAKGANPLAYVLSLGLDNDVDEAWLGAFADGLGRDQRSFGIELLGGDTNFIERGIVISVTAFGSVPTGRMVHRFGARAGDVLYVTGEIGAATAGLALLRGERGPWHSLSPARRDALVQRYRVPEPRAGLASALIAFASAAMDISDGLVGDCDKLCSASGCSAIVHAERVPLPAALGATCDEAALARLLTGGDDYEILAAIPPAMEAGFCDAAAAAGISVNGIGQLISGAEPALVLLDGRPLPLRGRAYVHGRE